MPENTLAGFEDALDTGVDTLELDLGVSRDNVVIIVNEQRLDSQAQLCAS
ncbi:MAG: glycerophosphoryl diester phosphodiesterase [Cryomorphaceae bacterium]